MYITCFTYNTYYKKTGSENPTPLLIKRVACYLPSNFITSLYTVSPL